MAIVANDPPRTLSAMQIAEILPHRYPFALVGARRRGSFDFYGRFFCHLSGDNVGHRMACLGTLRHDVPGAVLGALQCSAEMLRMYR